MFTSRFGFGYGMGYSAYKEATSFIKLGHSVTVVHCFSSPEIAHFHDPRIRFIYLPINKIPIISFLIYFYKLKKLLREKIAINNFDVVYIQSLEFGLLDLAEIQIPIFYFARSTMRGMAQVRRNEKIISSPFSRLVTSVLVALERRCMHYSRMIFVKSHNMLKEVSGLYGIGPDRLAVITGGIDSEDFQSESEFSCVEFKRKLRIPLDLPIILYAGRIVPQKGLIYLIEASLDLLREIKFVVIIAGAPLNKAYYTRVKKLVDTSDYKNSFIFLGHINQRKMSLVFNSSDCLVTPSLYEPFGMVNLQAAFLSKAIIATEVTGSIELLNHYEKIKVVKPSSAPAIATAIRGVFSQKNKKSEIPFDFQRYSWQNVAQQLTRYFMSPG